MLLAGILFDVGVALMAAAFNFPMLIIGRLLLGVAVAFASVAVTLYNSEMAPAHMRGRLNQIFQVKTVYRKDISPRGGSRGILALQASPTCKILTFQAEDPW